MTHLLTKPGESEKEEGWFGEIPHAQAKLELFGSGGRLLLKSKEHLSAIFNS